MRFSSLLVAAAAVTGFANALPFFTNVVFNNVTAGEPFTLTWANATGPVTLKLKNGSADDLKDVQTIVSGVSGGGASGGSYTWNVPATLPADTYAFEISDGGPKPNYSARFQLIGGLSTTASATRTASSNGTSTATGSSTTSTDDSETTTTRSSTRSTSTPTGTESTSSGTSTPTSAPAGGMAAGLTSNLAFVFLAVGALMTLN